MRLQAGSFKVGEQEIDPAPRKGYSSMRAFR